MAATIADIAARVGKTCQLVSAVLHGGRSSSAASEETRRRIFRAAEELGYLPNAAARAVSTGRFGAVGLLLSTASWKSSLPGPTLEGIREALAGRDMHLSLGWFPDEKLTAAGYVPKLLRELMADGLLIKYDSFIPPRMIALIRRHRVPAIWMNSKQAYDCVYPDDLAGARMATERLLGLGHRRIAYADLNPRPARSHYSSDERARGYAEAMKNAGLEPLFLAGGAPVPMDARVALFKGILSRAERPTAIVTYGSTEAMPALYAAAAAGLRVPEELSVVTFAGAAQDSMGVRLAAALIPEEEMGRLAVEMLMEKLDRPSRRLGPRALAFGFDEGQTCAPPCGGSARR